MEGLIKQIISGIFHVEDENRSQTSGVAKDRKISSRRMRSLKGDSRKSNSWSRGQLSRETSHDYDKTERKEFRTAVAAAAFAVNSIENKEDTKQGLPLNPKKSFSEIVEESPRPETNEGLPGEATDPTPTITTELNNAMPKKRIEKTPNFVADEQLDEKTSPKRELGEADVWEKTEMEKIKERFLKLKARIFEWEKKKKSKAKNKLTKKEGELEWKRARALQDFKEKMEAIEKISQEAIRQTDENRKNDEIRVKKKANIIRSTGKVPMTYLCCWNGL